MSGDNSKINIINKWYNVLEFNHKYDHLFYKILNEIDVSEITSFKQYDYINNCPQKNLLACLYFCEDLEKTYNEMGIPHNILLDSLHDLVLWNDSFYVVNGEMGLTEFPWIDRVFLMQIFRLGRLQFSMFPSEFNIPELNINIDEPVLEVHIPRGKPLIYNECLDSFDKAKVFFDKYFPNFPHKWCICHSWLLDDKLNLILNSDSNILKFQNFFKIVQKNESDDIIRFSFLWNTNRDNIKDIVPHNTFQTKIKDMALHNHIFYDALGIREIL